MHCPACDAPMIVVERQQIEVDYCLNCKGIWFDAGELALLSQALGTPVELPDIAALPAVSSQEKPRKCPRCTAKMDKIALGGVREIIIDRCPRGHGLWFDWGELGRFLESSATSAAGENRMVSFLGETFKFAG